MQKYKKDFTYSYAFGVFVTLELLKYQLAKAIKVIYDAAGEKNQGLQEIRKICQQHTIPLERHDGLVAKLSGKENTYAIGVFKKYQSALDVGANHLVLVNPADSGNLGAIIRTTLGFNITNLVIIRPAVDIFEPKTIRASMGALFQMRFQYFDSFKSYQRQHKNAVYPFMTDSARSLTDTKFSPPFSLVFGRESAGLPSEYKNYGQTVKIEQSDKIDSLNLPVAVAIALHQSYTQIAKAG